MIAMNQNTVTQAAEELGVSRERVHQLCHEYGLGVLINPRMRLLTKSEIAKLKKVLSGMRPGRPRKNIEQIA